MGAWVLAPSFEQLFKGMGLAQRFGASGLHTEEYQTKMIPTPSSGFAANVEEETRHGHYSRFQTRSGLDNFRLARRTCRKAANSSWTGAGFSIHAAPSNSAVLFMILLCPE